MTITVHGFAVIDTDTDGCGTTDTLLRTAPVHKLRPEVLEFALAMEAKLRKNDHKTGWHDQPIEAHIKLLALEKAELDVALEFLGDEAAMGECVDVANFALIIRDKLQARVKAKSQAEKAMVQS